jgi:hypothetical protein
VIKVVRRSSLLKTSDCSRVQSRRVDRVLPTPLCREVVPQPRLVYFINSLVQLLTRVPEDWYAKQSPDRFVFHVGEAVMDLDPGAHTVTTSKGRTIQYDHCILVCDFVYIEVHVLTFIIRRRALMLRYRPTRTQR